MRMQQKVSLWITYVFLCLLLFGCGVSDASGVTSNPEKQSPEKETADMALETESRVSDESQVSENTLSLADANIQIYIDTTGFDLKEEKRFYLTGDMAPQEFELRKADDGDLFYVGNMVCLKEPTDAQSGFYFGDFSKVTQTGEYFISLGEGIETDSFLIRYGYGFGQRNILKQELLDQSAAEYMTGKKHTVKITEAADTLFTLCVSCECNPGFASKEVLEKIIEHTEYVMKLEPKDKEEISYVVLSLCEAGCLLKETDADIAKQCLESAKEYYGIWQSKSSGNEETNFYQQLSMDAALFRASMESRYQSDLNRLLAGDRERVIPKRDGLRNLTYGGYYMYMMTNARVDVELCQIMMDEMLGYCTTVMDQSADFLFGLCQQTMTKAEQSMDDSVWLLVADYILVSKEYRDAVGTRLHLTQKEADLFGPKRKAVQLFWLMQYNQIPN